MSRILIVEDDPSLAETLAMTLEAEGHEASIARSLAAARKALADGPPDLVVLDLGLPDGDGLDLCRSLRNRGDIVPILILTARGTVESRVEGLRTGADDYLAKPFDLPELLARCDALLRRRRWHGVADSVTVGVLDVDFDRLEGTREGRTLRLTEREADLLRYLLQRSGQVVRREEILAHVWGLSGQERTRTVDVFIGRLRKYLEPDPSQPRYLINVRGVGYRLIEEGAST